MSAPTLETFFIPGPAGRIECLLKRPAESAASGAIAVVCHPYPLFGGTMLNKTVHTVSTGLVGLGFPTVRFNFRGAGLSEGSHDNGRGEQHDMLAVLDHTAVLFPGSAVLVAGYSFGAYVGLSVGCLDPRVTALIGVGMPVALFDFSFLQSCPKPLAFVQGGQDQFGPMPMVLMLAAAAGARVLLVPQAAHNFAGHLGEVERKVADAVPEGWPANDEA